MTDYIDFVIEDNPEVLAQLAFDEMASRIPGWDPIVGEVDTAILQAAARVASQVRASAGLVPIGIFRYVAAQFGLTPTLAQAATVIMAFTAKDTAGYVIPNGTQFALPNADGILYAFSVVGDTPIWAGNIDAQVNAIAVTPGAASNGIVFGTAGTMIDALSFIASVTVLQPTPSSGGIDAEEDADFLARIVRRYALQSAAPILPADFSAMALDVLAVGARTIAIDGYDAVAATSGNARTITVFAVDASGAALSAPVKATVVSYLAGLREINWNIYVADPVFFDVSVKWTAHAIPGYVAADVNAAIQTAVTNYLNAANWGKPALATDTNWTLLEGYDKVRLGELYEVINRVSGVAYVDTLFLKAGVVAPTVEVADITLTGGQVVVPRAGSVAGTVT